MSPAGGTMLGMSRTVSQGRTVEYEFLLLRTEPNGDINYVAKPSGQKETAFKLIRVSATEAVFENPQHDFPQRIIYTLKDGKNLTAVIEAPRMARRAGLNSIINQASHESTPQHLGLGQGGSTSATIIRL